MKRIISIITLTIMFITSLPVSVYISAAEALSFEGERAASENLYYSDIFYSYPRYLKDSPYLNEYQAKSSALISNVLAEYVTTDHFALSVTSQVLGQATDISAVIKYCKNNMNYQDFVFEKELDTANRLLLQAISENDIKKGASIYSKNASEQIKNFSTLTKLATTLEETTDSLEDAGYMADDIDMYEGLLTVTFDFLGEVAPRLSSKLPEINDSLEKQLGDNLKMVSDLADAMEFAAALAVTVMAQEAQLELVYDILDDAPADSMLYSGMYRLKGQLEGGAVTFFTETYLKDAVFKKVIDKFTDGIIKSIGGKVPGLNVVPIVLAVVDVVNTVVFKWILGADYDTYIAAVLLTDYKEGLAATLDNMSDRYSAYFSSDDIIAYDNVFNTYITVNKEVYNLYCKLSEHNTNYNSAYTASMSGIYEDMTYEKYIAEVKAYILAIPEEIRESVDHGTWTLNGNVTLEEPTDEIALGYCYLPKNFKGNLTLSNGSLTIEEGDSFTINGTLHITGNNARLNNDGNLTVTDSVIMGNQTDTYVYNNGVMILGDLIMKGYYGNSYTQRRAYFHNNGELTVEGDLRMEGTETSYFYMNEDDSVLKAERDISGYNVNSFSVAKGNVILCGTAQQTVKNLYANNLTVTNPEGIKYLSDTVIYGRYDLCGNALDRNGFTTKLESNASLAPDNNYGNVHVNCDFTVEGNLTADLTVTGSSKKITVPEDKDIVLDGFIYLYSVNSKLYNNGKLTVTDHITMGNQTDTYVYNNGVMILGDLIMKGYYGNSYTQRRAYFHNNGELTVEGDLRMEGTETSYFYMNEDDSVLKAEGDISGYNVNSFSVAKGNVILCGTAQQTVKNLYANNLTVTNPEGIKYLSDTVIYGRYDLHANALDANGFCTKLESNASLESGNDYGDVHVNCDLTIEGYLAGRLSVTTNGKKIIVAEGTEAFFDGLIYLHHPSSLVNDGTLTVTDSIVMGNQTDTYVYNNGVMILGDLIMKGYYGNSYTQRRAYFYNNGELTVEGDLRMEGTETSYFYMNEDDAILRVGGNVTGYNANSFPNTKGKVIFDGEGKQTVNSFANANVIEIENESYDGVNFTSKVKYTTLFDHKGNRFTVTSISNIDYDGDGMYDRYDPKPTVNEKASIITRDYDVIIGHADEISHIRYAGGIHETSSSIKNAEDRVDIDASVIAENTENNVYTRNMPDGGIYTFWIKLTDGTTFLRTIDMSRMKQRVTVDGVRITTHNLYGVNDYFIAEGDYNSYNEIKENGYIVRLTESKLGTKHDYTYTVSNPGRHTVLVRYKDTSRPDEVFKVDLVVDEPTFSVNGLQVTIGNIPGVKVIRTAYGEYNTPGDTKRAEGARNFSNKSVIKDAESYTIQYREEGSITIVVEYDNGYVKVFHHTLVKKSPTVEQNGNTVTFGNLDGLVMIRYAKGEYKTSSEIKKAEGSKVIKPEAIADGKISMMLEQGSYTFCVQYDDESYNYYTITVE